MRATMRNFKRISMMAMTVIIVASCTTPKNFQYFQDLNDGQLIQLAKQQIVKIKPLESLNIIIQTQDRELNSIFNKALITNMESGQLASSQYMSPYDVDPNGDIEFPVIGKVHVAGLTKYEAQDYIKKQFIEHKLLKDAVVTVQLRGQYYSILGEVNSPGRKSIAKDYYTILDAISDAGDATTYAIRDSIMVVRTEGDAKKVYYINLTKAQSIYSSPVFYVQQDDMIYVRPNKTKIRQSTSNGNETYTYSFWLSIISVLTTLAILLVK